MRLIRESKIIIKKSEGGFVLIAALMGIMILLAVGYFALSVTTSDLRVASRLAGERKAFSAAETGIHALCQVSDLSTSTTLSGFVDATGDPTVKYSATNPVRNGTIPDIPMPGEDLSKGMKSTLFDTVVTGEDTAYGSKAEIAIGIASAINPSDWQQGNL